MVCSAVAGTALVVSVAVTVGSATTSLVVLAVTLGSLF